MVATKLVDSMVSLLTSSPKPEDVISFRLPEELQLRVFWLLERNETAELSADEKEELDQFVFLEHIFRMAKARASMQIAAA